MALIAVIITALLGLVALVCHWGHVMPVVLAIAAVDLYASNQTATVILSAEFIMTVVLTSTLPVQSQVV